MRVIALLALLLASPTLAQQRIDRPGPVPHEQARTAFPEQLGDFRRVSVVSYAQDGSNMSAGYSLALGSGRLVVTVYIYPSASGGDRAENCRTEFEEVGQAIVRAYGDARVVESGPAPAISGAEPEMSLRSVHQFQMHFDGRMQHLRSESRLYCYVGGQWQVKYRATASAAYSPEILERFVAQGPWPGRAAAAPGTIAP